MEKLTSRATTWQQDFRRRVPSRLPRVRFFRLHARVSAATAFPQLGPRCRWRGSGCADASRSACRTASACASRRRISDEGLGPGGPVRLRRVSQASRRQTVQRKCGVRRIGSGSFSAEHALDDGAGQASASRSSWLRAASTWVRIARWPPHGSLHLAPRRSPTISARVARADAPVLLHLPIHLGTRRACLGIELVQAACARARDDLGHLARGTDRALAGLHDAGQRPEQEPIEQDRQHQHEADHPEQPIDSGALSASFLPETNNNLYHSPRGATCRGDGTDKGNAGKGRQTA